MDLKCITYSKTMYIYSHSAKSIDNSAILNLFRKVIFTCIRIKNSGVRQSRSFRIPFNRKIRLTMDQTEKLGG